MKKLSNSAIIKQGKLNQDTQGEIVMIFKVLYQKLPYEPPVRERTDALFIEGETEQDVREKLKERNYNIELIQRMSETHLEFEKQSENFVLENV